jgi:multiple sugar transport system substrate-binding protein
MSENKSEDNKISRRKYLQIAGGTVAGLVVGGALGYVANPGVTAPPTTVTNTVTETVTGTVTAPPATTAAPAWSLGGAAAPYKGRTLNALMISGEHDETGALDKKSDFVNATGIDFNVTTNDYATMLGKLTTELQSKVTSFDILPIFSFFEATVAKSMEPLEKYFSNPSLADPNFDFADLMDPYMKFECTWNMDENVFADMSSTGQGTLIAFPGPHSGTSGVMVWRTDLFEKNNLKTPQTWDDYNKAAAILHDPKNGIYGSNLIGSAADTALMDTEWHNRLITMGGQMFKGSKIDKNVQPQVDSSISVQAAANLLETSKYCAPGFTSFGFTEAANLMAAGKVAVWQSWNTIASVMYDPTLSKISDKVGSDVIPGTGDLRGTNTLAGDSLGIPSFVQNKEAAFLWLQWYTSKEMDKYRADTYGLGPVRWSTQEDPGLISKYPFYPSVEATFKKAGPLPCTAFESSTDIINVMLRNLSAMLIGKMDPEQAMTQSNSQILDLLVKEGVASA